MVKAEVAALSRQPIGLRNLFRIKTHNFLIMRWLRNKFRPPFTLRLVFSSGAFLYRIKHASLFT